MYRSAHEAQILRAYPAEGCDASRAWPNAMTYELPGEIGEAVPCAASLQTFIHVASEAVAALEKRQGHECFVERLAPRFASLASGCGAIARE